MSIVLKSKISSSSKNYTYHIYEYYYQYWKKCKHIFSNTDNNICMKYLMQLINEKFDLNKDNNYHNEFLELYIDKKCGRFVIIDYSQYSSGEIVVEYQLKKKQNQINDIKILYKELLTVFNNNFLPDRLIIPDILKYNFMKLENRIIYAIYNHESSVQFNLSLQEIKFNLQYYKAFIMKLIRFNYNIDIILNENNIILHIILH